MKREVFIHLHVPLIYVWLPTYNYNLQGLPGSPGDAGPTGQDGQQVGFIV